MVNTKVDIRDTYKWWNCHLDKMDAMLKMHTNVPITDWYYNSTKNIYFRMTVYLSPDKTKTLKLETGYRNPLTCEIYNGDYEMDIPCDESTINFAIKHYVFGL